MEVDKHNIPINKIKEKYTTLKQKASSPKTGTQDNTPLYNYSINKIYKLYNKNNLCEPEILELFRNTFTTVNNLGDMIILSQSKMCKIFSEFELETGQQIFPFFSLRTKLRSQGGFSYQKFGIIERKNNHINKISPYTFALYKMYGFSADTSGGAGLKIAVSHINSPLKNIISNLELMNIGIDIFIEPNISAKGKYLFVDREAKKTEFYSSIFNKNDTGHFLAESLLNFTRDHKDKYSKKEFLKRKLKEKLHINDHNHIKIWEAGSTINAEAGTEAKLQINNIFGIETEAISNVEAKISYIHYDIETIDSNNIAKIQNTGLFLKQVGASLNFNTDATIEIISDTTLKKEQLDAVKKFSFINSIEYKGPIYLKDIKNNKILYDKSCFVIGQSVSIARWKKYFIDDIIDYSDNLTKSPYVKMLAKKFRADPLRIVKFLHTSSIVLNESLYNKGIEPSAFLIEASYTVSNSKELMQGNDLNDDKIISLKIRYRLSDNEHNNSKTLKLGLNAGISEFEIGLNKIQEAGSIEIIDLYNYSYKSNEAISYSLLY